MDTKIAQGLVVLHRH